MYSIFCMGFCIGLFTLLRLIISYSCKSEIGSISYKILILLISMFVFSKINKLDDSISIRAFNISYFFLLSFIAITLILYL